MRLESHFGARKVPRPYKRRSVSAASDCPAASPDVIVTARSPRESLVLCAPSTRTPRTTYCGPSVTVKLRSTRPSRSATRVSRHVVMTKSRGEWRRWLLRGALTLPWPRRCLGAIRCVNGHRGHLGLSHGDLAPVLAARHAAVDSIAEIARAGVGVNRVCVWSSLLRSEIPKSASTAWPSRNNTLSGLKSRTTP